ncbi:hypothetical protein ACIPY5_19125 [Microbacterium sp. NPDC089698]|uniref:hypothetical protein n=1 Tax=Microbacterium sp. NPDC089698 TaxID=3364200 RepID=UPI00382E51D1
MRGLLAAVHGALRSGRFLTIWSLAATLPLSATVMAPFGAGVDAPSAWPATLVTWLCFACALGAVAVGERCLRGPRARAVAVVLGLLLCSALRPILQDLWTSASALSTPPAWQLPFRIATNVLVWGVVFAVVAVLEGSFRGLRSTNLLLRSVAAELVQAEARSRIFDERAHSIALTAASRLRAGIAALGTDNGTVAVVRCLGSRGFRTWSHRLRALADEPDTAMAAPGHDPHHAGAAAVPAEAAAHRVPYRVPAKGVVVLLYGATMLPYALRSQSATELLFGIPVLVVGGLAVDAGSRSRALARPRGARPAAFLAMSAVLGLALAALAVVSGAPTATAAVAAVVYLAYALFTGLCAGVLHAQRREQRRLSGAIRSAQRTAREGTRPAREGLRRTAELLHRDGQGGCTVFALAHPDPTRTDIAVLQQDLDETVSRMATTMSPDGAADDPDAELAALFGTWGHVMDLRIDESETARTARGSAPWAARDAYDLIAEGLLNAVKHGTERRVDISLDVIATGAGPHLRVQVRSFGALAPGAQLRPASHMRDLHARLLPAPDGAVLEAAFALPHTAVVSAEHPAGRPRRQP